MHTEFLNLQANLRKQIHNSLANTIVVVTQDTPDALITILVSVEQKTRAKRKKGVGREVPYTVLLERVE